ncbi:MAG TPA: histidine kinase [Gryllotalpicola sp.]
MRAPDRMQPLKPFPDLSDAQWVLALVACALAYYTLEIALATGFFFTSNPGPRLSTPQVAGTAALLIAQAALAFLRRTRPILMFVGMVALLLLAMMLINDRALAVNLTLLYSVYNLVARVPPRIWAWLLLGGIVCDVSTQVLISHLGGMSASAYLIIVVLIRAAISYLLAVPAGLLVASHERRVQLASEYAEAVQREQSALVAAAVAQERTSMARELHDEAAYHMSGIMVQTAAALEVAERSGRDGTLESLLESIRAESVLTLTSLREVIGVLRDPGTDDRTEPASAQLRELITTVQRTQPAVRLQVVGELDDLSPTVARACYRIVQESLSNARKHSPDAPVVVQLERDERTVHIDVRNAPPPDPYRARPARSGFGLVGMHERATLLGGQLTSARTAEGGWHTQAAIPVHPRMPL